MNLEAWAFFVVLFLVVFAHLKHHEKLIGNLDGGSHADQQNLSGQAKHTCKGREKSQPSKILAKRPLGKCPQQN